MKGDIVMSKEKLDELIAATKLGELINDSKNSYDNCAALLAAFLIFIFLLANKFS